MSRRSKRSIASALAILFAKLALASLFIPEAGRVDASPSLRSGEPGRPHVCRGKKIHRGSELVFAETYIRLPAATCGTNGAMCKTKTPDAIGIDPVRPEMPGTVY
ncbi:hypothetical protein [Bradyrhizobium sp.]|uniref:hypothetical protein n=1 Tax=Bradyrhizobium sp. TaxID=376 RepID=UPI0025BA90F1|nr:hypothetical protein [Bradyrhizobium sp.]